MDPGTLAAAHWLLTNVGLPILKAGVDQLMVQMGMKDVPITSTRAQALVQQLEQDIRRVESKIDEDRLARLLAALKQVGEAHKTTVERDYLVNALNTFYVVTNYPEWGTTGVYTNAQLRCIGFLGMAAAHAALNEPQQLVAEKMTEAVYSDIDTARQWLGNNLVNQIVSHFPAPGIICPKCGFENSAGSRFCNRDGYPLTLVQKRGGLTGAIVQTFKPVFYSPARDVLAFGFSAQYTGTLIVRDNALEFQGKKRGLGTKSVTVQITHIKQISLEMPGYVKVIYGDDSTPSTAFFADVGGLGFKGIFGGTKLIAETLQKTYLS